MRNALSQLATPQWLIVCGLVGIAGILWITGHRAHVLDAVPYLLFLACPLMHLFMHHGHGHEQAHAGPDEHPVAASDHRQEERR